ncbi:sushi domain-containing protein 6 [Rhineura floridana]|uniref:sushi domain-containing protein 6 n=1 Tax=Rhineura floridana TaxID=261503 RepID=UPI002AC83AD0|nr:sushi domain-containing protein 6 [Rhineura floridana]XP_061467130.1 sushi domain-containing protein 6 [Rhineura floridana]XP_061467131.1 sushi domain-containing protein 6 [Rhineura floridana]XP_061467132.1 sushi domain-containing protein 6 [Rhineura floridana]
MCHGMVSTKSTTTSLLTLISHGIFFLLVIFSTLMVEGLDSFCPPPPEPENGGYICHPSPCKDPLTSDSVIEYLCEEGYLLKGDYKYLTCKNGKWNPEMEITCRLSQDKGSPPSVGVPTLSVVASTASSVALILLLVVLFVLLQPKLKSFHHSRRDQGVSGDQVSIVVDGVQVALPSYEEAVYGSAGNCIPPSDSRVQIVLSEGAGQSGAREMQQLPPDQVGHNCFTGEDEVPGHSGLCEAGSSQHSEAVLVHQATTSSWVAGTSCSRPGHKEAPDSENSDVQSLLSLASSEEYTDDIPLLKEA